MKKSRLWRALGVCLVFGIGILSQSTTVAAGSSTKKTAVKKPAAVNIGWGDGKNIVVPLQIASTILDEVDVEANQYINYQAGKLNGVDTLVLTVPLDQIAMPQNVKVISLRTGAAVTFVLELMGNNVYGFAPVQSGGKIEMKSHRLRLNVGWPEERKNDGKINVCYVPPPTGSYWVMTKSFTVVPSKRKK